MNLYQNYIEYATRKNILPDINSGCDLKKWVLLLLVHYLGGDDCERELFAELIIVPLHGPEISTHKNYERNEVNVY